MNRLLAPLYPAALLAGLAAIAWAGAAALQHHALALAMTVLIAGFYGLAVWELQRFRQASRALAQALAGLAAPPQRVEDWLAPLPAALGTATMSPFAFSVMLPPSPPPTSWPRTTTLPSFLRCTTWPALPT